MMSDARDDMGYRRETAALPSAAFKSVEQRYGHEAAEDLRTTPERTWDVSVWQNVSEGMSHDNARWVADRDREEAERWVRRLARDSSAALAAAADRAGDLRQRAREWDTARRGLEKLGVR